MYSGWRRGLDPFKFLTAHNLTKRNTSSLPEAMNWAGEIPRKKGKHVGGYLLHLEKELPKMQAGMGDLTDRHLDSGERVWPALGTAVPTGR